MADSRSDRAGGDSHAGDSAHMRRALELAERGWGRVAPNPLVGAVIVREGEVVGEGWHSEYGAAHAEVEAIRAAGGRARGATIFITLEPCAHHGKTPPCTEAILAAGIRRVVYAVADPDPMAEGGGDALRRAGLDVTVGVEEAAAYALNRPFFRAHDRGAIPRPWTQLKLALSLDGRVADATGRSNWITGDEARTEVHRMRAGCDGIAVGIGTALADDPSLTVRGPYTPRRPPVRIIFDRQLRLPPASRLARSAGDIPVWIVCGSSPPAERRERLEKLGVRVIPAADLPGGLFRLRSEGIDSLFCEGGARLASAMLEADLIDRLTLFYAPLFLGAGGADPFVGLTSRALAEAPRWSRVRTSVFGDDTLICLDR